MNRNSLVVALCLSLSGWGCAQPEQLDGGEEADLAKRDLRGARDATAVRDLAKARDLSSPEEDLAEPEDLAVEEDLAVARPDLARRDLARADLVGADLRPVADLAVPDLLAPPDLAVADLAAPDLRPPPDLARPDLARPDMAVACTPKTSPCDVMCQNCAAGQKCGVASGGGPQCQTDGTVGTDALCSASVACKGANVCVKEGASYSSCHAWCRTNTDCKNGGTCSWTLSVSATMGASICSSPINNCDVVGNAGCSSGGCYPVTPTGETGCHDGGSKGQDDTCTGDWDCKGGYVCISDGVTPTVCRKACNSSTDCFFPYINWSCYTITGSSGDWPFGVCG